MKDVVLFQKFGFLIRSIITLHWRPHLQFWMLRECLCKSDPVDFARDTDFAHFLCVVRHSCTNTKTTIRLIGSLYFSQFFRKLNFTQMRACRDTFQDFNLRQFWRKIYKKTTELSKKQIPQPCILTPSHLSRRLSWTSRFNKGNRKTWMTPYRFA